MSRQQINIDKKTGEVIESLFIEPFGKYTFTDQTHARYESKPSFKCGSAETAVPGRSIPLNELFARFLRGENIASYAMSSINYNSLEDNPFKRKGFDLADLPNLRQQVQQAKTDAQSLLDDELKVKEDKSLSNLEPVNATTTTE